MQTRREHRDVSFRLENTDVPDVGGFAGWASVFHRIDAYDTIFAPTAFDGTLSDFLSRGFVAGLNHDWDDPIGAPVEARIDPAQGLFVRAELVPTAAADKARVLLSQRVSTGRTVVQSLSFGFQVLASTDYRSQDDVRRYWASVGYAPDPEDLAALADACSRNGVRVFTEVKLLEISPVTVPGNKRAEVTEARNQADPGHAHDLRLRLQFARLDV